MGKGKKYTLLVISIMFLSLRMN